VYSDTHPECKDPCTLPIISYWRYTTILNSEMNSHLLYNMCASVYADFCRPTGLESARPRPGTYSLWNHQGYHKLSVYGKIQYYSQCGKTIYVTSSYDTLTLALIAIMTIDRPCRQCSRSSICQSPWSVSMNPVTNWIQSNATSKVRMGLTSWPRRRTWLGRSCSQLISWQQLQYIRIETNFNSKVF